MNKLLTVENIQKIYHTKTGEIKALDNLSLDIYEGEFVCIVGSSGCGKSTLLSILSGLDTNYKGLITWHINSPKIGYMFQNDTLFPWLTIKENASLGAKIQRIENNSFVDNLLKEYSLYDFKNKKPCELSGGMKQRVALIRTLAINPDILLLDEPFSALDYQTRLSISNEVYKKIKSENKTAIMITHDIGEAISLADRIIILSKRPGKVKCVFNIKFKDKVGPIEKRTSSEFNNYYQKVWKEIDINV